MCGVAGIVGLKGQPVNRAHLETLNAAMAHRGPDGDGIYCHANIGLMHRRLAIIDPRAGIQPFFSDNQSMALCYNGEVYNYSEIRQELASEFNFRTASDTEVVLRAWEKWSSDSLQRFRGMFAFALYDQNSRQLYLVRDRVGIKPLYYAYTTDWFLFGSELTPLLKTGLIPRVIRPESVADFFRFQYVPTPGSIYENVFKLEPGHFLKIDLTTGNFSKQKYWDLELRKIVHTEAEWLEALNAELDDIIRIYTRSDVPFGCFLSGGVDSSLVTALMSKHLGASVRTFSIGFAEPEFSELAYAAEASRIIGTEHYEKIVSSQLALDILLQAVVHFGEPFGDSSAIPTFYVSHEAAHHVKMVLSGDGGDELFAGYNSYQTTFRDLDNLTTHSWWRRWFSREATLQDKHNLQRHAFTPAALRRLLRSEVNVPPVILPKIQSMEHAPDPVTLFQAQDFKTYLVDDILTKVDRMSMANSLEVRVPLLDHRLVELAFAVPLSLKLRRDGSGAIETKYLLRQSALRFYPATFLNRRKMGFGIPIIDWCQCQLRDFIQGELGDPHSLTYDWVRFSSAQELLSRFYAGDNSLVAQVWFLLMFDLWIKYVHTVI